MTVTRIIVLMTALVSCATLSAKPRHDKHHAPDRVECRTCDGRGKVRTWYKAWLGWRACDVCDGRGHIIVKKVHVKHPPKVVKPVPPPKKPAPPPKKPAPKHHGKRR